MLHESPSSVQGLRICSPRIKRYYHLRARRQFSHTCVITVVYTQSANVQSTDLKSNARRVHVQVFLLRPRVFRGLTLYHGRGFIICERRRLMNRVTIGRVAAVAGVNVQTVRYYERMNLLRPSDRKPSGYRLYGEAEVERLRFIKNAQAAGFTLREVSDLLSFNGPATAKCSAVQRRAQEKLLQVERHLSTLQALARSLRVLVQTCKTRGGASRCPLLVSLECNTPFAPIPTSWRNVPLRRRRL